MSYLNNVLITGATGFLGKPLIKQLSNKFTKRNIFPVIRKNFNSFYEFSPIVVDGINSTTDWSDKLQGIDCVIHCAARVHIINEVNEDPIEVFREVNVRGTLQLARSAAVSGVKRFIFISSIKVNGESTTGILPYQSSDTPNPEDPYGISKAEAEEGLKKLAEQTGMDVVVIRPPLVYGPGVKANFAAMLKLVSSGVPLPFGCIKNNQRSMVYVENLVSLIIECINNTNAANQTFLVSDDDDLSTKAFVQGLSKVFGKSCFMIPVPNTVLSLAGKALGKTAIIDRLCGSLQVDISYTKNTLNWQPPYSVEQGFVATVNAFKN